MLGFGEVVVFRFSITTARDGVCACVCVLGFGESGGVYF